MTNGPSARIAGTLAVRLERPRSRVELADDPRFNGYRSQLLRYLFDTETPRRLRAVSEAKQGEGPA